MTGDYVVRGLPTSIAKDGWWLMCDASDVGPEGGPGEQDGVTSDPASEHASLPERTRQRHRLSPALLALVLLVALADWLFWGQTAGISLALFSWAVFLAAFWLGRSQRNPTRPALLLLFSSLPVIEHLQALSMVIQVVGLIFATAWLHLPAKISPATLSNAALRLFRSLPLSGISTLLQALRKTSPSPATGSKTRGSSASSQHLRNWGFPVGGALVLVALLLEANPLLEQSLADILTFDLDIVTALRRAVFWSGAALLIWPFLVPQMKQNPTKAPAPNRQRTASFGFGLNAGSVLRALITFNLILGLQSVMDLSILFAGAELPAGMTLASYAHRGAYPLLVTAMLAGGFALAARPYLASHASLKPLMMLWLGQNALLGLTSLLRLELYVDAFGLTYLRIYAMIWIGLVVMGLLLTGWQIHKSRSNSWLLLRSTGLGLVTLYLCAFVNFASLIAAQNLTGKSAQGLDWYYICELGPMAAKGIANALDANPDLKTPPGYADCWQSNLDQANWRKWGFRSWRQTSYAATDFRTSQSNNRAPHNEDLTGR